MMAAEVDEVTNGLYEDPQPLEEPQPNGNDVPKEPVKKRKLKVTKTKLGTNADEQQPKKKKAKRVTKKKKAANTDTTDDENENVEGGKKKKKKKPAKKTFERRNIKSVFSEENLEESTKNALAEEQQRLQRLQQAQRDALANEVLRDFDLKRLPKLESEDGKSEEEEEEEEEEASDDLIPQKSKLPSSLSIELVKKEDVKKDDFIDLSSDEEIKQKSKGKAVPHLDDDGDSSDIQILSDVEEDVDDPDNSGMHTDDRLNIKTKDGKVLINISEKNPEEPVHVAESIQNVIKPHQIGGVRFLYDNIIESPSTFQKSQGFGCILAHSMGLGKTLQVVTFSEVFLRATSGRYVLIIVPINTLQNWNGEFKQWLPHEPFKVHLVSDSLKTITQRAAVISKWRAEGGVLLMGYELFRLLAGTKAQQKKKKANKKKPVCIDIEEEDKEKDIIVGKISFFLLLFIDNYSLSRKTKFKLSNLFYCIAIDNRRKEINTKLWYSTMGRSATHWLFPFSGVARACAYAHLIFTAGSKRDAVS